ncbi:MAG: hypothetical protein F6K40_39865 [Okeania sp. SIO3I5]|uniref:hypothetical protein n=1 Tax=Okeania sp. SIO3I5 TaxID=2607805 RepID=UPI0013B9966C|nr:hypothetical protein [Okeania sp. SIO3I5]NEQ42009.1 hypothetical protein [Okeania sp. SIO3I5]
MQQLLFVKQTLLKLGHGFIQLLVIIFVRLPVVVLTLVLVLIFPSLRRKLYSQILITTAGIREKLPDKLHSQLDFLIQVLQVTAYSNGNSEVIYPLLQANLDKLDNNFVHILQTSATAKFLGVETNAAKYIVSMFIANAISDFSTCLKDFPLGNKANNMEIVPSLPTKKP